MTSDFYNQQFNPREMCYLNRFLPFNTNSDIVGIAVNIANVILYFCLRILVTWSSAYIDVGVQGCLFQIYPILLSTTLSINRKQLNVFDANFALTISSSPLTLYLVVASIGDILGLKTGLYKRIKRRHFVRPFLVILPFIWLGLSLTLRLSNHAFKGSDLCDGSTLGDWLKDLGLFFTVIYIKFNLMLGGQITAPLITLPIFLLCLFRRRSLVMRDVGVYWKEASNPWRRLLIPLVFVKVAWCTIKHYHVWCIHLLYYYLDFAWAIQVMYLAALASVGYELTYGQLLAVFAIIPTVLSALKVIYVTVGTVEPSNFHRLVWAEFKYLAAGIEPEPAAQADRLPQFANEFSTLPSESHPPKEVLVLKLKLDLNGSLIPGEGQSHRHRPVKKNVTL